MKQAPSALNRRNFIGLYAAGAAALSAGRSIAASPGKQNTKPNVLFINVDQLSAQALSCYGSMEVSTPWMDSIKENGFAIEQSYSADPVCCPGRAAWFSGRYTSENRVVLNGMPMVEGLPLLSQELQKGGYYTAHFGKWHVPGRDVHQMFDLTHDDQLMGEHQDAITARSVAGFISNHKGDKPFFCVAGLLNPHDICYWRRLNEPASDLLPENVPEEELPPLPPNFHFDEKEPQNVVIFNRKKIQKMDEWSELQWRYYIYAYYRYVEMVDEAVGVMLRALRNSPHADNTVVVFSADHGDGFGRHKLALKNTLYDEVVRVPLIFSGPGIKKDVFNTDCFASGVDLFPTVMDFAGLEPSCRLSGSSLKKVLQGRPSERPEYAAAQVSVDGRMIRTKQYKYITYEGDPVEMLFDMKSDPWETQNLASSAAHQEVLKAHRKLQQQHEASLDNLTPPESGWRENLQKIKASA
ncbi:Choline-sulfatase [Pontiella desulfatans]|uniref:Choline-sulfatase n=1 Tax=Pontiella desulfatans TaxID=2750659 RepID=A0A6C2U0X6_PONDE|nr:sulfatase-like hydrolase/transferase [Pontiella desulfatans]SPS73820.1 sulfatase S1_9 [Kiritimatiellales bacterium]VGO13533.1 Choline-sulfatase [Pontiella desulfatans]